MDQIQSYIQQKHKVRNSDPTDRNKKTNTNADRYQNDLRAGRQAGKDAKLNNAMNGGAPLEKLGVTS